MYDLTTLQLANMAIIAGCTAEVATRPQVIAITAAGVRQTARGYDQKPRRMLAFLSGEHASQIRTETGKEPA